MSKLVSFIIPSRYPEKVKAFFDNLQETTQNPTDVEVLVKFDADQLETQNWLIEEQKNRPFSIKYIHTPRLEGVFSSSIAAEQLFHLSDPNGYFVSIMSDEPRFLTFHWDSILLQYKHFFPDDIFRLRISNFKFNNYSSNYQCAIQPDSFPIYTRRWLELTEGTGDCWGSDAYQQCAAFHLSLGPMSYLNFFHEHSLWRDIVVHDIEMDGLEFGVGISLQEQIERDRRNLKEWNRLSSHPMQEHFSYLSTRLYCAILAYQHHVSEFRLIKQPNRKTVQLIDSHNNELAEISYAVPRIVVYTQNLFRRIYTFPRLLASRLIKKSQLWHIKRALNLVKPFIGKTKEALNPDTLIAKHQSLRERMNRAYRTIKTPYYFITNHIDKWLNPTRPGISLLFSKKPYLADPTSKSTKEDKLWLEEELKSQHHHKSLLQTKKFKHPVIHQKQLSQCRVD